MANRINNPTSGNRGISLTEVLISLGVLAVGLLGVAAVFPVGGHYMQRGDRSDRADAIAQAALNDAITRGLLDPESWVAYEDLDNVADSKSWPTTGTPFVPQGIRGTFSRPYADDFRQRLRFAQSQGWTEIQTAARLLSVVSSSIVIDPQAVAALVELPTPLPGLPPVNAEEYAPLAVFPSAVDTNLATGVIGNDGPYLDVDQLTNPGRWRPWVQQRVSAGVGWPIQRVSVQATRQLTAAAAEPMGVAESDRIVLSDDDLALELPDEDDQPSQSRFVVSGGQTLLRQARQEYSWMLTVTPTTHDAYRALATGGDGAYDVSAVVFNKRAIGRNSDLQSLQETERLVRVSIQSEGQGGGGGEVIFFRGEGEGSTAGGGDPDSTWEDPLAATSTPWDNLRPGQWVYLFGPHVNSTDERPLLFAQWYRVLSINRTEESNADSSRLGVQLRGPDWPWTNTMNINGTINTASAVEGTLFAVIVPDVVAVHTRTLNLQAGSVWGQ